ncbi:MAG: GDSL-type esterase/lipase family protein [Rhodococcus sp. (in: high G+C Gram-positive bacteria)]|uniref:GDSL-type esterase/lipase family protein n=1 Tax=Rhodococcus sp. TaxID=1831 RepID=UPI003BB68276
MTAMTAMTPRPIRLCFFGDSFVAGVGDPTHRGWVGLLAERAGQALGETDFTVYNLGVRRDTTADVRARWFDEVRHRFPDGCDNRLVFSFGVNDTTRQADSTRVRPEDSVANLAEILDEARANSWPVLVVGPPPIADGEQNARTAHLDGLFAAVCAHRNVPYRSVFGPLDGDTAWMREAAAGDGAHPAAQGYRDLANIVLDAWSTWIGSAVVVGEGR